MQIDNFQVAMTYSVELFLCMLVGLVAGHVFFNSGQSSQVFIVEATMRSFHCFKPPQEVFTVLNHHEEFSLF